MKILLVFAGQGYKESSLFNFFREDQVALSTIKSLSDAAKIDFLQANLQMTDPKLSQLIIGAYQLTLFAALNPLLANHQIDLAGYSLGEVSAFLASIRATPEDCMNVLSYRTELMTSILKISKDEYDLLSIVGTFILEDIKALCAQHQCSIAIINSSQRLVLGGKITDLKEVLKELPQYHLLHATFLEVHLPSHTPFYSAKSGQLQHFMQERLGERPLHFPIISPLELGKIYTTEEEIALLDRELYTGLQWFSLCNLVSEYNYDLIIDLGPGNAMTSFLTAANDQLLNTNIITAAKYNSLIGLLDKASQYLNFRKK